MVKDEELWGEGEEVVIIEDEFVEEPLDTLADGEDYEEDNETVSATEKVEIKEDTYEEDSVEYDDEDDAGIAGFLSSNGNRLLLAFGALIALVLIGIGIAFIGGRARTQEVADFADIGVDFKEIGIVGEENINLIFDKEAARLTDLYEAKENYDYDEADEDGFTVVSLTATSVLKDLKIKFVNSKNKLIGSVPFEIEVTTPGGKTEKWVDDDKDGIIYKTDLSGGSYSVKLVALDGYSDMYEFTTEKTSVTVKTQLDYKKVDVSNEIKDGSKIDTSKEDSKENETQVESKLTDTVKFVMTEKVPSSEGYAKVSSSTVQNPKDTIIAQNASLNRFRKLANIVDHTHGNYTYTTENGTHTAHCGLDGCEYTESGSCTDSDGDHKCDICNADMPTTPEPQHTHTFTTSNGQHTYTCTDCDKAGSTEACVDSNGDNKCDICNADMPPAVVPTATVSLATNASTIYVPVQGLTLTTQATITPTVTVTPAGTHYDASYSSSNTAVATVDGTGKVTAVAAGTVTITYTVTPTGGQAVSGTVNITVVKSGVTLDVTKKVLFIGGETLTLHATDTVSNATFTWASADTKIATVTSSGVVTAVAKGTTKITVTDSVGAKAEMTVIVYQDPTKDTDTLLTDKSGKQLYVKDGKNYRKAVYADYYKNVDLYVESAVTYIYHGWWTIDGKTYYFDTNGNKVTGEQVILGAKYVFGSDGVLKSGTGAFGIDVSKFNGTIDWNKVAKSGVSFAIIRCGYRGYTQGGLISDEKFATNIKNATAAGVKVGVYFFTQAINEVEAVEEASMALSQVAGYKLSYPIFLDVESVPAGGRANNLSVDQRTAVCEAFCKTVTNAGYKSGVYANKSWFTNKINASKLTNYTIWLAQYASSPTYTATRYDMWQYSDAGSINGISGNVDLDLSYVGY